MFRDLIWPEVLKKSQSCQDNPGDNAEVYFGKGTKLTVLGKSTETGNVVQVAGWKSCF